MEKWHQAGLGLGLYTAGEVGVGGWAGPWVGLVPASPWGGGKILGKLFQNPHVLPLIW